MTELVMLVLSVPLGGNRGMRSGMSGTNDMLMSLTNSISSRRIKAGMTSCGFQVLAPLWSYLTANDLTTSRSGTGVVVMVRVLPRWEM